MEIDLESFDKCGGYDPYGLSWDETIIFPSTRKLTEYGNKVFNRYPARSIFLVPRATLHHQSNSNGKIKVLDSFMGSGTTAVEASRIPSKIFGVEMDPFARMVAETSIISFTQKEKGEIEHLYQMLLSSFEKIKPDQSLYPELKNVEYWFHEDIFVDLLKLKTAIFKLVENALFKKFFLITFADSIKPSSKMERQSTKPYISSKYEKKIKPVKESFEYSYNKHFSALEQYECSKNNKINWLGYDATDFTKKKNDIDIAITSPPYLNALDYTHIIKVDSAWIGTLTNETIPELKKTQVGHDKRIREEYNSAITEIFSAYYEQLISDRVKGTTNQKIKIANTCLSYFEDIKDNLQCIYEVLKVGGEYHMIIGDNVVKGIEIPTHRLIAEIAEDIGFKWFGYYKYPIKDHRTSIPRMGRGGKIKYEYVLMLKR